MNQRPSDVVHHKGADPHQHQHDSQQQEYSESHHSSVSFSSGRELFHFDVRKREAVAPAAASKLRANR
jgi:hypothetical protein